MLSSDRHRRVRALFERVREQPPPAQGAALVAACTGDDADLLEDVARLLASAARADSFLEHGAAAALGGAESLIGQRFGLYEIQGVIGAGGMGEVYRARDTTLGRDVALKLLPEVFAADPDRVARFQREAQILASLNHPQIAAIYGVEESSGARALVLELVEGPTLADRIAQGAVPLDEAVPIARQITQALEAAHALGIVHRDLKPANIKLRPDGAVKVLDFGLAKALEPPSAGVDGSGSRTLTSPVMTRAGVILGTAAYMSPEQARGRAVDRRSDIWAFGCVLFEMLTGEHAFDGEDLPGTLASILTREPAWSSLPSGTPPALHRLLRRCLEKDRSRRLADVADARLELDERVPDVAASGASSPSPASAVRRFGPWWVAGACLVTTLGLAALRIRDRPPSQTGVYRASILIPGRLGLPRSGLGASITVSPDGRRLAFVVSDSSGHSRLWIRALDGLVAEPLADTVDAASPFWSPNSRWLGFVQNGRLRKIDASGGQAVTVSDSAAVGGTWSREDVILFTLATGALAQVPAAGGTAVPLTTIDSNGGEVHNLFPFFLPDGRSFVYVSLGTGSVHAEVYLASLDATTRPVRLPVDATVVQYASGFLWFLRGSTLMAQPFDPVHRRLAGEAVPVAEQIRIDNSWIRTGVFSPSDAGTLVVQTDPSPGYDLVWYDRQGRSLGTLGARADYSDVQLSPDGRRVLVSVAAAGTAARDLWIFDVARGLRTRFTFDDARPIRTPIWSRDGARIAFASERQGHLVLLQKSSNGAASEEPLLEDGFDKEPTSWSPDGRFILYARRAAINAPSSWVLPLEGDRKPFELAQPRARFPQFSPDGRWILYASPGAGRAAEVYIARFPGPGSSWQVSTAGGFNPRWRADGKEVFYLYQQEDKLMSAAVSLGPDHVVVGEAKPLFDLPWIGPRFTFDVSPDGGRILALTQPSQAASAPLTLIVNWPALLKQ
jgi:Tol biopolymer transport system component